MSIFAEVDHIERVFNLPNGGTYVALSNIELKIRKGEFISLVGHSGCGKSTLLNLIAGLDKPTRGGIILEGRQVTEPGPDRMVVFQNYSLLPWLTVRENIALAVESVMGDRPRGEQRGIIEHHIDLVGLRHAAHKRPAHLSGGMKQRVAIARSLAIRPKLLLLDEPFGALDALTRGGLQEQLMRICEESQVTCIMVTHDVDEALLLSDRIVLLTNGPASYIGQILDVPIPRPRTHVSVVKDPNYYGLRNEIVYFLNQQRRAKKRQSQPQPIEVHENGLEKVNLNLGFIPLTDCAPLVVAKERGFFAKHGLTQVTLSRELSWNAIESGIREQRLDAAQMVAGMPLGMTIGRDNHTPLPVITAMTLSRNGNAITFHRHFYEEGVRTLADLKGFIAAHPDRRLTLGAVHPTSMHNLILRYWLASADIDPDRDLDIVIIPPAQMVANLKAGNIDGYCVGEPWNSRAVHEGIGFVMATDPEIWSGHCEKVLGVREDWAQTHPKTHLALIQALLEACDYCDDMRHREEVLDLICRPEYVGSDPIYTRPGFIDAYNKGIGDPQPIPRYNQFFCDKTNCPDRTEALWILTQMARWGITPFPRNWIEVIDRVRRLDMFSQAAQGLNMMDIGRDRYPIILFDGAIFNPDDPIHYLEQLQIKTNLTITEIDLNPAPRELSAA
ncbi:MAG: nitrate ABC transporter ATP-binding protein [Limnospira sp. PMC 1291.21]|uniref:Nitrate transport ATP-binding protein NrtC n=2 Tax=Limnospira TaxID=2596745 RepID=A0A9P1NZV0_9CYAN|nr:MULTISPECIES: nitrate ABC transporter ATP-binding protein [Limnospira]EKD07553.1 nitrate ABC transporter ATPase subunits C and D [Arthrospira platensis C1]MDY7051126.1 nitrate ABC transporter ATP-binding protein [Limnospira fusiformis LS22]QJB25854.1 ABC transporter substrate-binding protein [Limnospira fusiformis SAG 85.79]MDT9178384.1 nitrate ABC transporter ATP-binding protein [Limnospira sp. PMC 1238.20]MDT9189531.1 nitrate ABC transporter ATP-binding protein [Limnospira sp. PMC 894.15]